VLDPLVAEKCKEYLLEAANGKRIVSVSQKPIDLGDNVCVGDIGRIAVCIDYQIVAGLEVIDTPYVAIAEHDCIYTREHYDFVPPDDKYFWYNDNNWLVQYENPKHPEYDGMYSYVKRRRCQSQLTCSRDLLLQAESDKIAILTDPRWMGKYPRGRIGEPGAINVRKTKLLVKAASVREMWNQIRSYISDYNARDWSSKVPNLDIRHKNNFTGPRRGTNRTFDLPPWGPFESVMNGS
jgi:hypothetical protein